jgi:hypothetical protein
VAGATGLKIQPPVFNSALKANPVNGVKGVIEFRKITLMLVGGAYHAGEKSSETFKKVEST